MLSIRIVTAGAVLAFAVSAAAAQDSDTTPGQPGSLLKMLMHSSEATPAPQDKPEAKRVAAGLRAELATAVPLFGNLRALHADAAHAPRIT